MAESVKLINSIDGGTLTRDVDFSLFSKAVSNAGVVEGLSPTQVGGVGTDITIPAGEALVKVTRTSVNPNEIFYVVYRNTSDVVLTSGNNKKIFIEIEQTNINTPSNNTSPTGENIGSVKIADNYPSDNFLKLGETDGSGLLGVDVLEFYTIKQQVATKSNYGESNTGNDSYEISIPGINSYFDGLKLEVKSDVANTGACTLNVNGLGAKSVKKQQGTVDLIDGDWGVNGIATLVYNSTLDVWQFEGRVATTDSVQVENLKKDYICGEDIPSNIGVRFGISGENNISIPDITLGTSGILGYFSSFNGASVSITLTVPTTWSNVVHTFRIRQGTTILATGSATITSGTYTITMTGATFIPGVEYNLYYSRSGSSNTVFQDISIKINGTETNTSIYKGLLGYPIIGVSDSSNTIGNTLSIIGAGFVGGFSGLLIGNNTGDLVYLQSDSTISTTVSDVLVGYIASDAHIFIKNHIKIEKSKIATTGSIPLGNAVGYIIQNIPGLGNIKTPYYNI